MKTTNTALVQLLPRPTRMHRIEDPERASELRRLDCQQYNRCLGMADVEGWRGFHCGGCQAYVPLTPTQRYRDQIALLEMLAETQVLSGLVDGEVVTDEESAGDGVEQVSDELLSA